MQPFKFLAGYPEPLLDKVRDLIERDRLGPMLAGKYAESHAVRNDGQLYEYVQALKQRHLRRAVPLGKVLYDAKLQIMRDALGTHTATSRPHGGKLKAVREIRIATVFRDAPADFLKMIVVHELAHLKEMEHDKAFYGLCRTMAPDYDQLEFDARLWLTHRDLEAQRGR